MAVYIFDGSFEGLLSAVYEAIYARDENGQIIFPEGYQENLFSKVHYVETNGEKTDKVYASIQTKISREALYHIMYAFLTEDKNIGTYIFQYLTFGWKIGNKINMYLDDTRVKTIHDISRRVKKEKHRMLGLLRFRRLGSRYDVYYASYEPDNNITMLLAPHFARRFSDQNWIIHDVKRNIASCYNCREWMITDLAIDQVPPLGEDETLYQRLWKEYYQSISISERKNPKLMRQMMPARYWKHLTEITP